MARVQISVSVLFLSIPSLLGCASEVDAGPGSRSALSSESIPVRVDPMVEMVSTLYHLAGVFPFNTRLLPRYADEMEEWFGPFKGHPAIQVVRELGEDHGINGSAPMSLALHLTPLHLDGRVPLSPLPEDLDHRWTPETVAIFQEALGTFAEDTRFMEFFAGQSDFYDRSVRNLRSSLEGHTVLPWLQDYFAQEPEGYLLLVGMQIGNGNYGMTRTLEDGSREFVSIIGASSPSFFRGTPRFSRRWVLPVVIHEFAHSFVNPVVDGNEDVLREIADRLYPYHREKLWPQGYRSWRTLSYEYLVRATVNRYLTALGDFDSLRRRIEADEEQGFIGITLMTERLGEYEGDRDLYPDLEEFIPRVEDCFREILGRLESR